MMQGDGGDLAQDREARYNRQGKKGGSNLPVRDETKESLRSWKEGLRTILYPPLYIPMLSKVRSTPA